MVGNIKEDLREYFRENKNPISTEVAAVVADVVVFTSNIVRNGFEKTLADLPAFVPGLSDRPFVEVADVLVDHHLRLFHAPEKDILRKSLLEAYFHVAGPKYVFEPTRKTRLVRSLRKSGPRNFAALLCSLHLFNIVSRAIQDDARLRIQDIKEFDIYMLGVETVCRKIVEAAAEAATDSNPQNDEQWARSVVEQIQHRLSSRTTSGLDEEDPRPATEHQ